MHYIWNIYDIVLIILEFASILDLFDFNAVCKLWKQILDNESFWKKKTLLEFPSLNLINNKNEIYWKNWIKRRLNRFKLKKSNYI